MRVTERCDVYSFGVVALEVIQGTHPVDLINNGLSMSMLVKDILDRRHSVFHLNDQVANQVVAVILIAVKCIDTDPHSRPTMHSGFITFEGANNNQQPLFACTYKWVT